MEERNSIIMYGVVLVAAAIGLLYSNTIPGNAKTYPMFVLGLTIILAGVLLINSIIKLTNEKKKEKVHKDSVPVFTIKEWGVMIVSLLYILALKYIGFIIASVFVFLALAIYLGYRKWIKMFITCVLSVAGIWYIFFELLHVTKISGIFF